MQTFWQDLTLAARLLRKSPGFTIAAVLTLALGIGANATIFSFADAMLLRTLPVPDAERIVHVYQQRPTSNERYPLSYADYLDYRAQAQSFEALAAHYPTSPMHLVIDGDPHAITGAVVTASYFDLLQVRPAHGRFFTPEEDRVPDRDAIAVVSYQLWERWLGGAANVVGRTIRINDRVFTIIGVAPKDFAGVKNGGPTTEVWIPTAMFGVGYRFCNGFDRGCTIVDLLGKLKPGVSIAQAQQEMDVIARRLAAAYPATNEDVGVRIVAARGSASGAGANPAQTQQLRLFLAAVGLVMLIGCANIAGLLLARAIRRRKEIAVRLALGATRGRLIRQLLTECLLLAVIGGGAGLLLAFWGKDFVGAFNATDYAGRPRDFRTDLSGPVIAATTGLTVLASLLFGLVPALQASRPNVMPVLKDEGASGGASRVRLRHALVVGQITLAVTLLVGATLLVRSMDQIIAGPGFDPRPIVTLRLRPGLLNYPTPKAQAFQRAVIERLESLPGVVSASPGDGMVTSPLNAAGGQQATALGEHGAPNVELDVRLTGVGPRYFATLGVSMLDGREFDDRDHAKAPPVAVVNDVLAQRIAPDGRVSGRTLLVGGARYEIVGVIKDAQYYAVGEAPHAVAYRPYWQPDQRGGFNKDSRTFVRVAGDPAAMMATIRREIAAIDPAVPISEDYPLSDRVAYEFQSVGMARTMLASFAVLALVLCAVGLYGVLAFTVAQRTREIGVRVALGAGRGDVAALVLRDGLSMTITGAALGLVVAWTSARFVASLLYGVDARDALAFLVAPLLLIVVALVASYLPARRAARVSPMIALRYE